MGKEIGSDFFQSPQHRFLASIFTTDLDMELTLVKGNLALFGCVEYEEEKTENMIERIDRIKPTKIGLFMFSKALYENYI